MEVVYCGTQGLPGDVVRKSDTGMQLNALIGDLFETVQASETADTTWFLCMVQGNYYNRLGMFTASPAFDFCAPYAGGDQLAAEARLVPFQAVSKALQAQQLTSLKAFLSLVRETPFASRFILTGPPPPRETDEEPLKHLEAEGDGSLMLSPASVRRKLWCLQNDLVQCFCAENGLRYLQGDLPGTTTPEGFLKTDYVKDSVHAIHFHAHLLLDEVANVVRQGGSV